jgi:hypothetical protein
MYRNDESRRRKRRVEKEQSDDDLQRSLNNLAAITDSPITIDNQSDFEYVRSRR